MADQLPPLSRTPTPGQAPRPALSESDRLPTEELAITDSPTDRHRRQGLGAEEVLPTDELPAADLAEMPTRVLLSDAPRAFSPDALDRQASMLSLHFSPHELSYLAAGVGMDWRSLGGPDAGKAEKCGRLLAWAREAGQADALLKAARAAAPSIWTRFDRDPSFPQPVRPPKTGTPCSGDAQRVGRLLSAHYPLQDLHDLVVFLLAQRGVDWDDLAGPCVGKLERVLRLVAYAEREGFLHTLMASARELDPEPWYQFEADPAYPPAMAVPVRPHAPPQAALRVAAVLSRHYAEDQLRKLAHDALDGLGLDWDDFGGSAVGRSERAVRLVAWAHHNQLLDDVMEVARQIRPRAWEDYDANPEEVPVVTPPVQPPALEEADVRVANTLSGRFSRSELKALAYQTFQAALGLDWTDFGGPGTTKREWVERVIWYAREVGLLNTLLARARDWRKN
jgi:hypothetical protein